MPRLPQVTGEAILAALEKDGWYRVSQEGSHVQLRHEAKPGKVSVALHTGKTLLPFIVASILKQAGLTAVELLRLLK